MPGPNSSKNASGFDREIIQNNPTICERKIQAGNTGLPRPQEVAFKLCLLRRSEFFRRVVLNLAYAQNGSDQTRLPC